MEGIETASNETVGFSLRSYSCDIFSSLWLTMNDIRNRWILGCNIINLPRQVTRKSSGRILRRFKVPQSEGYLKRNESHSSIYMDYFQSLRILKQTKPLIHIPLFILDA